MRVTRAGWAVLSVAGATLLAGRTVQVAQLWMIGAGLAASVLVAVGVVGLRPARLTVRRTIEPAEVQVGAAAHMVLDLTAAHERHSAASVVELDGARFRVPAVRKGTRHRVMVYLPTERRGVHALGPVMLRRSDALDLVQQRSQVAEAREVVIAPRTVHIEMARLGVGALGSLLLQRARQFGVGEFEGLRHYVEGDDLRLVHWKASARSSDLLVKQFSLEGARRCTVALDTTSHQTEAEFELAVSIAASLMRAAHHTDLAVRLVTTGGLDLPAGTPTTMVTRALALVATSSEVVLPRRDPSEGLGVVVCVTPDLSSDLWRRRDQLSDPLLVTLAVTQRSEHGTGVVDASSLDRFAQGWNAMVHGDGRSQ